MDEKEKIRKLRERIREIQLEEMSHVCSLCKRRTKIDNLTAFKHGFCCDECLSHLIHITWEPGGYIWWN